MRYDTFARGMAESWTGENCVPESYLESALRHFEDSDLLAGGGRVEGAGHLIGFAAECAIKHAVASTPPGAGVPHVHLPQLVERVRKTLRGRTQSSILTALCRPNFMSGWVIENRYDANGTISVAQYRSWRDDANRVMSAAGLRRSPR